MPSAGRRYRCRSCSPPSCGRLPGGIRRLRPALPGALSDRTGHPLVLGMTHEEVVTDLARQEIHSYRQLPSLVYQIQTKFRDEPRSRGGLVRTREFLMKDAYSFDRDQAGLAAAYARVFGPMSASLRAVVCR